MKITLIIICITLAFFIASHLIFDDANLLPIAYLMTVHLRKLLTTKTNNNE
jgi:hypothetical protein